MAAVAALLTSCSKDDTFGGPTRGKVTFEVSTPELATRYGEGTTATNLQYAVYDMIEAQDGKLVDTGTATLSNKTANVTIDLVEGRKYTAIFWADAGTNSPYDFDEAAKTVSYKNLNDLQANQEAYDAFYAFVPQDDIKVGQTVNVTLKRPFAQLRIETSDAARAKALGVEVVKTGITVDAYTSFNLETGALIGDKQNITFAPTTKASAQTPDGNVTYDLISMNYLLVNEKETVDVTLTFTDDVNGTEYSYIRKYSSIDVQRNYRTLVRGSILTDPTVFNVTVDQEFSTPDINEDATDESNKAIGVSNATELQAALNAATDGTIIYFTADIEDDVTTEQKQDVKVTILGNNHSLKGMLTVDGKSSTLTSAGITIKDIVFDAESISGDVCIRLGDGTNGTRYTCNVTIENCTFDVPNAVGIKSYTGGDKNLIIRNCTATTKAHSLVQIANAGTLTIEDCEANSKNGINVNQTPNVVIDNYTANVRGYAVRFGASSGGSGAAETYSIKNSSLKSACEDSGDAVIILRGTADYSTLTIENTTIEGNPAITNTATDAKVIIDGTPVVSSATAFTEALNDPNVSEIIANGEINIGTNEIEVDRDLVLDMNGNNLTSGGGRQKTQV